MIRPWSQANVCSEMKHSIVESNYAELMIQNEVFVLDLVVNGDALPVFRATSRI